jgi:hypothetical protein
MTEIKPRGISAKAPSWRDTLEIHPAAELFPPMSPDELKALGEDIKQHGMMTPITVLMEKGKTPILDGRNRLDALELAGFDVLALVEKCQEWKPEKELKINYVATGPGISLIASQHIADPYDFIVSCNLLRRNLSREDQKRITANILARHPERSDRSIAKEVGLSPTTVGTIRDEGEASNVQSGHKPDQVEVSNGENRDKPNRVEATGRKARGRKPAKKSAPKAKGAVPLSDAARPRQDQAYPVRGRPPDESSATEPVPQELAALKEEPSPPLDRVATARDALAWLTDQELVTMVCKVLAERRIGVFIHCADILNPGVQGNLTADDLIEIGTDLKHALAGGAHG